MYHFIRKIEQQSKYFLKTTISIGNNYYLSVLLYKIKQTRLWNS